MDRSPTIVGISDVNKQPSRHQKSTDENFTLIKLYKLRVWWLSTELSQTSTENGYNKSQKIENNACRRLRLITELNGLGSYK